MLTVILSFVRIESNVLNDLQDAYKIVGIAARADKIAAAGFELVVHTAHTSCGTYTVQWAAFRFSSRSALSRGETSQSEPGMMETFGDDHPCTKRRRPGEPGSPRSRKLAIGVPSLDEFDYVVRVPVSQLDDMDSCVAPLTI